MTKTAKVQKSHSKVPNKLLQSSIYYCMYFTRVLQPFPCITLPELSSLRSEGCGKKTGTSVLSDPKSITAD